MLVEEDPADELGSPKGAFPVTGETDILQQQGGEQVPASFEQLWVGQLVEAEYAGPVAESYPSQGTAGSLVILEPSGDETGPTPGTTSTLAFELTVEGESPQTRASSALYRPRKVSGHRSRIQTTASTPAASRCLSLRRVGHRSQSRCRYR